MRSSPASSELRRLLSPVLQVLRGDPADLLRWCLILLAAMSIGGTAVELAMLRHWGDKTQLVPWFCLGLLALATAALAIRPGVVVIRGVRSVCAVVALGAGVGVYMHIRENYRAGPLDAAYSDRWDSMSTIAQLWAAFTKTVGPSPARAPMVLIMAALCLVIATPRHPVLVRHREAGSDAVP